MPTAIRTTASGHGGEYQARPLANRLAVRRPGPRDAAPSQAARLHLARRRAAQPHRMQVDRPRLSDCGDSIPGPPGRERAACGERLPPSAGIRFPRIRVAARPGPGVVEGAAMGTRKALVLDPDTTARKVAAMAVGRAAAHRERLAAETGLVARLAA